MTFWVKKFVREAIMRDELMEYGVAYKLDNGKYYWVIIEAYSYDEAKHIVKRNLSDDSWLEFNPSKPMRDAIKTNDYLYVFDSRKKG